jgi:hypothetical protein
MVPCCISTKCYHPQKYRSILHIYKILPPPEIWFHPAYLQNITTPRNMVPSCKSTKYYHPLKYGSILHIYKILPPPEILYGSILHIYKILPPTEIWFHVVYLQNITTPRNMVPCCIFTKYYHLLKYGSKLHICKILPPPEIWFHPA